MSTEEFTGTVFRKRFKGIENFLKRVAFNLGNTQSQTDVKIISCIPIDVTDLQQKIIHLERQLEDATSALQPSPLEIPQTCKSSRPRKVLKHNNTGKLCINTAITESNCPACTSEAVSCNALDCDQSTGSAYDAPFEPTCFNTAIATLPKDNSEIIQGADDAVQPNNMDYYCTQPAKHCKLDHYYTQEVKPSNKDRCYTQEVKPSNRNCGCTQEVNQRQTLFKMKKKFLKNKKGTSPFVYYAQTYSSPFIKSSLTEEMPNYDRNDVMSRSYLAAMVSRQYKPEVLGDNISLQSQFSSPVCRDVQQHSEGICPCESDICSGCHFPFHNIDDHVNKQNNVQTYMLHQMNQGSDFYDTNQYDLVPVKEKPVKIRKDLERPRKKEPRPHIDMKCWPENVRKKYGYQSLYPLSTTNYYTARPRADYTIRYKVDSYGRKMPVTYNRTEPITRILAKRRKEIYRRERSINMETSKSCSIDFGNVYPKKTCKKPKNLESLQPIPVAKKNAECLTTAINNSECQTELSTIEVNSADAKTEATLNQIKNILQSVLAEVKVSSQTKGLVIQNKPMKDAVVQKGPSRNNMQASSFMNSITYSPYAMHPNPYITSFSRQTNPSQYCCPHGGMKPFHNFPVIIQNPAGRHVCSSCYRNSQLRPSGMKPATTTATNTEQLKEEHSKETEKLIKEIYKSMALTLDFPNKDTSLSEYDEVVKSLHDVTTQLILKNEPKKQPKIIKNVVQPVSELFMKKDMIDTSDTFNSTVESKLPSHEVSTRSHMVASTDTEFRMKMDRREKYLHAMNKQPVVPKVEEKTLREAMVQNANSITESETSSSEPDTSTTIVGQVQKNVPGLKHKKGKEGLLSKMLKSVKLFKAKEKPKKCVEKSDSEEVNTSDSDDYQTVYSLKIDKNPRYRSRTHNLPKRKTHSKISYNKTYQRDRSPEKKRSPYMEQEYRRYWDEKLMFHNNRSRYSSERQSSERSTPQKPAYYQTYEARTALVQPNTQVPKNELNIQRVNDKEKKFNVNLASKGTAWLKKHKMGIHCGEQWKKFILES